MYFAYFKTIEKNNISKCLGWREWDDLKVRNLGERGYCANVQSVQGGKGPKIDKIELLYVVELMYL